MPQRKSYQDYYTASETKKILGVTDGMLYNYVRNGNLERITPPGRKQGVYRKEDVNKFALELHAFLGSREKLKSITFTPVTTNDIEDTLRITEDIFKSRPDKAIRTSWVKKNSDVSYQLCLDGSVVGAASILPLSLERIEKILAGEVSSERTPPDEIENYEPGRAYHLYIMGVGVSSAFSKWEKRLYGSKLVRGIGEVIIDLGKRGIEIATISARSHTVDGIRILRHLGFQQIPSVTRDVNFRMNVWESDMPIVKQYREAFVNATRTSQPRSQRRK